MHRLLLRQEKMMKRSTAKMQSIGQNFVARAMNQLEVVNIRMQDDVRKESHRCE